jgi:predicted P-loop ATPase
MSISGQRRTVDRFEIESTFTLPDPPSEEFCRKRLDLILEQYRLDIEMIDNGRDGIGTELIQSYEKRARSEVMKEQQDQLELGQFGRPISDEEANLRVKERVERFVGNLDQRIDEEVTQRKEAVIAKAVQDLYRSQLFDEGTRQHTVFMVMNRMRLDAGLPPAILREPE